MRNALTILILVAGVFLGQVGQAQTLPAPFGVRLGAPLPAGFAAKYGCEKRENKTALEVISCATVPKPLRGFNMYHIARLDGKVAKIVTLQLFENDAYGSAAKSRLEELSAALTLSLIHI